MKGLDQRTDWRQEYEDLRQEAIRIDSHRGHGLALFLSRGMMAWLEVLTTLKSQAVMASTAEESANATELPSAVRLDMTMLLADMVLYCMEGEGHECIRESHS